MLTKIILKVKYKKKVKCSFLIFSWKLPTGIYRDKKQDSGCLATGRLTENGHENFGGDKCSKVGLWWFINITESHLQGGNFLVCKLYLNKVGEKKSSQCAPFDGTYIY